MFIISYYHDQLFKKNRSTVCPYIDVSVITQSTCYCNEKIILFKNHINMFIA